MAFTTLLMETTRSSSTSRDPSTGDPPHFHTTDTPIVDQFSTPLGTTSNMDHKPQTVTATPTETRTSVSGQDSSCKWVIGSSGSQYPNWLVNIEICILFL